MVRVSGDGSGRQRALRVLTVAVLVAMVFAPDVGATHFQPVPPDRFGADCVPVALWGNKDYDVAATTLLSDLDLTGDGAPDLVLGVPRAQLDGNIFGAVYITTIPPGVDTSLGGSYAILKGPSPGSQAGHSTASAGDLNGDGVADLVIGAPVARAPGQGPSGAAFVFYGPIASGTRSMWDADAVLIGGPEHGFGASVAGIGDVDGDGNDDLLIGAPGMGTRTDRHGGAFLFHGPLSGTQYWHESDVVFTGGEPNGQAGRKVAAVGDLDGDGRPDLAIGAPHARSARGTIHLVHAHQLTSPSFHLSGSAAIYEGERTSDTAGDLLVPLGDIDGDGKSDLLIGAPTATHDGIRSRGSVYLVDGSMTGNASLLDAPARFIGAAKSAGFGSSAAVVGDLDGDGRADLAVGAPGHGSGTVYRYSGFAERSGKVTVSDANDTITGKAQWDGFGFAVSGGDLDLDGLPDLVVAVPGEDGRGTARGAIRHFDWEDMTNDRDGDRLLDGCELRRYGTDPDSIDTDGDNLYDGEEALIYGTDPRDRDTDGDLHSDLIEVIRHTDPWNPFHFPVLNQQVKAPIAPFREMPVTDELEPVY